MDPRKLQFLQAVVGHDGARALMKAAEHTAELDQAIFPRTIIAWLETISRFGHDGSVPGIEDVKLNFKKSESGFEGFVTLDGALHRFEKASINHLAGCVAVALGLDHERIASTANAQKIAKLGKSIDLLVKSRIVQSKLPAKKINLPGVAAQPRGPQLPNAPIATQPANQKQAAPGATGTAAGVSAPQLPKQPKKKPTAPVTKSESSRPCAHCGKLSFANSKYVGCYCFASLAKNVKSTATATGYMLEFNNMDSEEITTLLEGLRGK